LHLIGLIYATAAEDKKEKLAYIRCKSTIEYIIMLWCIKKDEQSNRFEVNRKIINFVL